MTINPNSSHTANLADRLETAIMQVWEYTNGWPEAIAGHKEIMEIVQALRSETRQTRNDVLEEAAQVAWKLHTGGYKGREYFYSEVVEDAIRALKNADPQVPAKATSGTEGEIAAHSGVSEVATQRPVDTPAESASPCVVAPPSDSAMEIVRVIRRGNPINIAAQNVLADEIERLAIATTPKGDA